MTLTTLSEDYVLAAEAKGLSPRRVLIRYAARNAVLPSFTGFAISLGFVVSGSIIMEIVFSYPGIGYELLEAVAEQRLRADAGHLPGHHDRRARRELHR